MSLESRLEKVSVANLPSANHLRLPKGSTVRTAVERMRDQKFEVVLVMDGDQACAILTPERIRQRILGTPDSWEKPVEEFAETIAKAGNTVPEILTQLGSHAYVVAGDRVFSRAGMLRLFGSQLNFQNFNQTPETERAVRAREQVHS